MSTENVTSTPEGTIAAHVRRCLNSFNALSQHLKDKEATSESDLSVKDVQDELSRFQTWSGDFGANEAGESSLDHRLRDHSSIERGVVERLEDLNETLQEATAIVQGEKVPWEQVPQSPGSSSDGSIDDEVSQGGEKLDVKDDLDGETELKQLRSGIKEIVDLLVRLTETIH